MSDRRWGSRRLARPPSLGIRTLIDAVGDGVARVPAAPTGLGFLPPRRLAFRLPAGMLAATYSRVWAEPLAADRTRSLPGLWHGDASGHHALVRETGSGQNAWVSFGKQGWVNSRERRSRTTLKAA